jgi:hypothetical protein
MIVPPFLSRQRERLLWQEQDQSASDYERSRGIFGINGSVGGRKTMMMRSLARG